MGLKCWWPHPIFTPITITYQVPKPKKQSSSVRHASNRHEKSQRKGRPQIHPINSQQQNQSSAPTGEGLSWWRKTPESKISAFKRNKNSAPPQKINNGTWESTPRKGKSSSQSHHFQVPAANLRGCIPRCIPPPISSLLTISFFSFSFSKPRIQKTPKLWIFWGQLEAEKWWQLPRWVF